MHLPSLHTTRLALKLLSFLTCDIQTYYHTPLIFQETTEVSQLVLQEAMLNTYSIQSSRVSKMQQALDTYKDQMDKLAQTLSDVCIHSSLHPNGLIFQEKSKGRANRGPISLYLHRLEHGNVPVKYFNVSLEDLTERYVLNRYRFQPSSISPPREGTEIPLMLSQSIVYLGEHAMDRVGLFRVSARKRVVDEVRNQIDVCTQCFPFFLPTTAHCEACMVDIHAKMGGDNWDESETPEVVSGVLKLWLRELPEPLITYDCYDTLCSLFGTFSICI